MLPLPRQFTKNGYMYNQVMRGPKKAIYAQHYNNVLIAYEVIKIRQRPTRFNKLFMRQEPAMEIYPSSEQWGKLGWTLTSWPKAFEKYNHLD